MSDKKYKELIDGERVEYSVRIDHTREAWIKGKVLISESGKYFIPDDKSQVGKVLYPSEMHLLRKEDDRA